MIKNKLSIKFYSEPIYEQKYMPKENMHFTCIACITIDSVMRIDKKILPQELDSENVGAKFDAELMAKLKSGSDSE